MSRIEIRLDQRLGTLSPLVYGQFTEHLVNVIHGGIWTEILHGRKFETPLVHPLKPELAGPWEAFPAEATGVSFRRSELPIGRYASPGFRAHHSQAIDVAAGAEGGIAQGPFLIGVGPHVCRGRVRAAGSANSLKIAVRDMAGAELGAVDVEVTGRVDALPAPMQWMHPDFWQEFTVALDVTTAGPAQFTVTTTGGTQGGTVWLDWVSLMPANTIDGLDPEVVALLRDLPVRLLKWPGGCMADNYDWRMGIGPRDARYCFMDQAWLAWDEDDFGTEEFMRLCRETAAEPFFCVNSATGSPELAAAWVAYCNDPADTEMGALRAANGSPEPHRVKYWCIGNEQWGFFERGFGGAADYARRYRPIAEAMRRADPSIVLVAVGEAGEFNRVVLEAVGDLVDMLSIHIYDEVADGGDATAKVREVAKYDRVLDACAADIEATGHAGRVRLAVDEWGWSRNHHAGGVLTAAALNSMARRPELVALGAKSCATNVDGLIRRDGLGVFKEPSFHVFNAFNRVHRDGAVRVETTDSDLDVAALTDESGTSIFVVNMSTNEVRLEVAVGGREVTPRVFGSLVSEGDPWGPSTWKDGGTAVAAPLSFTVLTVDPG